MSRRLTVEADGGSRGNPGVAGYGALVRDTDTGALLAERAEPLGKASNNVAEYRGLIAGLEAACAIDPSAEVHVRLDSKLVVEQMSGRWKIKHEDMRRLALQARDLVSGFTRAGGSVRFTWIPRAENKAADALSNVAMDGRVVDRTFGGPSEVDDVPGVSPRPTTSRDAPASTAAAPRPASCWCGTASPTSPRRVVSTAAAGPTRGSTPPAAPRRSPPAGPWPASCRATRPGSSRRRCRGRWRPARPWRRPSASTRWSTPSGTSSPSASGTAAPSRSSSPASATPCGRCATTRPTGRRVASRTTTSSRGSCRRGSGSSPQGGTSVVVCHRKPILVVLAHLLGLPHDRAWRLAAAPGSLTAVEVWDDGEVSVAFTNRT